MSPRLAVPILKELLRLSAVPVEIDSVSAGACGKEHLQEMLEKIESGAVVGEQAHRWLGWIQAVICASGTVSLKQLKKINQSVPSDPPVPIPLLLFCPRCLRQHVDEPKGTWTNPPHATHTCQFCQLLWRPGNYPTTGVRSLELQESQHFARIQAADPNRWKNRR